ncbi:MAG: 3-dehydroquinate dehydratase [Acidobacteria bacterium]|nr:MAG: 3-dehydroquinate dehydratase [Acidobacteriota bacterium]
MKRVHVLNGPNLGRLEWRDSAQYGDLTLAEIESLVRARAETVGIELTWFQSDHEGALIEAIHAAIDAGASIVINPGALTHYSYALADALAMAESTVVEVHLSNIHAREDWRRTSVVAPAVTGSVAGFGPIGYVLAIEAIAQIAAGSAPGDQGPDHSA